MGLVLLGCGKKPEASPAQPGPGGMPGPGGGPSAEEVSGKLPGGYEFVAAKKVYANNNCANCHKLGETGGGKRPGGPDLTTVGAKPEHTKQWIADHVRDPKSHKGKSMMPAYGADKISDADLNLLAEYLASQK